MKNLFTLLMSIICLPELIYSQCSSTTLIISSYLEGSSNNKCIEVYNGTGVDVVLSNYNIQVFANGATSATSTTTLGPGTMLPGATYVICNPATTIFVGNQTSGNMNFNGDDAVALRNGTTIVDVIGQIGFDPGTTWGTGACVTLNATLYKDLTGATCPVDAMGSDVFVPSDWVSGGTCAAVDDISGLVASPLPVKFSIFDVENKGKSNNIMFSTLSEVNNDYFTIERSADGRSFDDIAKIAGAVNSTDANNYQYTDNTPIQGVNYYRIRQTDYDGTSDYSEIKSVTVGSKNAFTVNPRSTYRTLDINTEVNNYAASLYNVSGQLVKSFVQLSTNQTIDIEDMPSGIYYLKISQGGQIETFKISKL